MRLALTAVVSLFSLIADIAHGQSVSSRIGGQVPDPLSAPLANAEVVLKVAAKGMTSRAATNESGVFVFPGLNPGKYDQEIRSEGLQALRVEGIELLAAQRWHQVFRLELPTLAQEITVRAQAESLNTVATHRVRGGALTSREASDLPLLQGERGRLFGNLMFSLGAFIRGGRTRRFLPTETGRSAR